MIALSEWLLRTLRTILLTPILTALERLIYTLIVAVQEGLTDAQVLSGTAPGHLRDGVAVRDAISAPRSSAVAPATPSAETTSAK